MSEEKKSDDFLPNDAQRLIEESNVRLMERLKFTRQKPDGKVHKRGDDR